MEDAGIVALFLDRNEEGIRAAADKYGKPLRQLGLRLLADRCSVEECENNTYLQAWDSIPPHQPKEYFFPYLARIMRHKVLDVCRVVGRRKKLAHLTALTRELEECIPSQDNTQEVVDSIVIGEVLNAFFRSLPEESRNIFLRRYWFFDPISHIAIRYAISQSKVKTTLFRTRQRLRNHLEKEGFSV